MECLTTYLLVSKISSMSTNTKRVILDLAESLLQEKGFNGFSYAHIATELGVKNAAIHYHFPTKEALMEALAEPYIDSARARGLHGRQVVWRHAFKNAMMPIGRLM